MTPLQALVLRTIRSSSRPHERSASAVRRHPASGPDRGGFRALIGRQPDELEARIAGRLFDEQKALFAKRPDEAARFLGVGDSAWDESLPRADFAAMTMAVSAS
jgi:hypothetical protein